MPRRYHTYPPEFQVLNVLSSAGAAVLALGYLLPLVYLAWSLRYGARAGANPWGATGPRVADRVAAADPQLRQPAERARGRLRLHAGSAGAERRMSAVSIRTAGLTGAGEDPIGTGAAGARR